MIIFHQKFMPVKYIDETTKEFIESDALKNSGAPRRYGIKTIEDLVSTSLSSDKKVYNVFRAKLW